MSILGTAVSGLRAYQRALATTSHNIANASTPGYSRQRVEMENRNPQLLGSSYVGQGVQVTTIERMQNELVNTQLRSSLSSSANGSLRADFAERVDTLLSDETTGLAPVLDDYFSSIQDVADDPTSVPARTVMLNDAGSLVESLNRLNTQIDEQRTLVNGQISTTVDEINQYSKSLADLNARVVSGFAEGATPNDVLDLRDNILNSLAEKIDVTVTPQDDGTVSVFIGNGQTLVMGAVSHELVADHLTGDPENLEIGLQTSNGSKPINVTRFMSGGEIGGLIETRTGMLDTAQNQLGLIGLSLASQMNAQNRLGLDLNGDLGGDIFDLPDPVVNSASGNKASGSPTVAISDVTQLSPSDYRLRYDGTDFQLTSLPDNKAISLAPKVTPGAGNAASGAPGVIVTDASSLGSGNYRLDYDGSDYTLTQPPDTTSIPFDGTGALKIDTNAISSPSAGDSWVIEPKIMAGGGLSIDTSIPGAVAGDNWLIQPTRFAASGIEVTMTDPEKVAAAGAVRARPSDLNTGAASIKSVKAVDATDSKLLKDAVVTYTATGYTLTSAGVTTPLTGATDPSTGITTITANGWELQLKGTPKAGDQFVIASNAGQKGDNRNMLAMADIQNARVVQGTATIQGGYNSLMADVGTQTRQAQIARDSSATLLESAQAQREAISGVNLDEEAADMLRYQQAYQACAQVISVSNTMFDTLLNAFR